MASHWTQTKLEKHIQTQKGFAFKSRWYCASGRPLVKVGDFIEDSVDTSALTCIPEETADDYLRYELRTGDVIIQTVGSWPTNPRSVVGKVVRIPAGAAGALLNQNAVKLISRGTIDMTFLFYLLRSTSFKTYIVGCAQGAASQASIALADILGFRFFLPTFATQRKIAAILSAYDGLIENNIRRIKILEEMAQTIYREWFIDFRFPGHENAKMVESELGLIPEGWLVGRIGDLCELRKDSYVDGKHGGLRLVDLARMRARTLSLGETGRPSELTTSRILFQEDDILFGSIRPYLHKVALAPFEGVTNVSVLVIRPYRPHLRALLAVLLGSEDVIRWADQYSTGTKMPVIKWDTLRAMPVALPRTEILLERFQECIGPMLAAIKRVFFRNLNLRCTRDLLMPRLISGEIDVENLDIGTGEAPA